MATLSMDGTDPATWDPALDGVLAAPENHKVLYEDEAIRVISVTIAPGAIEKPHHHCLPAVFVVDRLVSVRDSTARPERRSPCRSPRTRRYQSPRNFCLSRSTMSRTSTRGRFTRPGSSSNMDSRQDLSRAS
jgi:predicted metal-dependent enzyme (double-stranded beta helix superfamily)